MNTFMRATALLAAAAFIAVGADAQVVRTQSGRELDANYQVGSGGYNARTVQPRFNQGQLFITGQVSGLGAFRGPVGYDASDQYRISVPSADLAAFRRQSVSLRDVLGGRTFRTAPYYDPARTVFGGGGVVGGLTAPGTNEPLNVVVDPRRARLAEEATRAYRPLHSEAPGRRLTEVEPESPLTPGESTTIRRPEESGGGDVRRRPFEFGADRPVRTDPDVLFALPRAEDRFELARELYEGRREEDRPDPERGVNAAVNAMRDESVDARTREDRLDIPLPGETPAEAPQREENREAPRQGEAPRESEAPRRDPMAGAAGRTDRPPGYARTDQTPERQALGAPNRDVYTDLITGVLARESGEAPPGADDTRQGGAYDAAAETTRRPEVRLPTPSAPEGEEPQDAASATEQDADRVELTRDEGILLHGLAGTSADLFNAQMARAEELLRRGRYYSAAEHYELAVMVDSSNPLARLGLSASLLMAGEPVTAGLHLRRAMEMFPPMMETRLDMKLLADRDRFRLQMKQLDRRLADTGEVDPLLALTAAYYHYSAEGAEAAAPAARKLREVSEDDALLQAFARFLLTGRRPAETNADPATP